MTMPIETKQTKVIILRSLSDFLTTHTGGAQYMAMLFEVMNKYFNVQLEYIYSKRPLSNKFFLKLFKFLRMILKARKNYPDGDIFLLDRKSMFFLKKYPNKKYIGLTHHISTEEFHNIFKKHFYHLTLRIGLKKPDIVVAVSQYYKDLFTQFGAKDVRVIYNAFDDINLSNLDIKAFKEKHNLYHRSPLVYIGNNRANKGVVEVYDQLKNCNFTLITSGPRNETNIPVLHFNLPYYDYLKLLASCQVVVTMSKVPEGWCRTAHEAMLVKTPVIGNGIAGMRELLAGGDQIICEDIQTLNALLSKLLSDDDERRRIGEAGYIFAEKFSKQRFEDAWISLLNQFL